MALVSKIISLSLAFGVTHHKEGEMKIMAFEIFLHGYPHGLQQTAPYHPAT